MSKFFYIESLFLARWKTFKKNAIILEYENNISPQIRALGYVDIYIMVFRILTYLTSKNMSKFRTERPLNGKHHINTKYIHVM